MRLFKVTKRVLNTSLKMPKVPAPETLKTEQELGRLLAPHVSAALRPLLTRDRPVEFRPVAPGDPLHPKPGSPRAQDWVRVRGTLPDDPVLTPLLTGLCLGFFVSGHVAGAPWDQVLGRRLAGSQSGPRHVVSQ